MSESQGIHVRVQELERSGVIRGYRAVLDRAALGVGFTAYIAVGLSDHTKVSQVAFEPSQFARFVPWLMLNRGELAVLVHPETGDDLADHTSHALWLGEVLGDDAGCRHLSIYT